jgi:hypothetical protein
MSRFYLESTDSDRLPAHLASPRQDQLDRWDSDPHFWKLDTWTEAELCDDQRIGHYLANVGRRSSKAQ